MKKSTPSLDELVDRLAVQIQARYKGSNIQTSGKDFLKSKWIGQEARLYEKVKKMENQQIQFENLQKRIDHREVVFQCGCDVLGFPIYVIHEAVFQTDVDNRYRKQKNISNQKFLNSRQYTVKQH